MPRPRTLPALTSLRFVAALWVVLYHGMVVTGTAIDAVVQLGFVAVPFFFLLSGFILGHVYLSGGNSTVQVKRFLASRFARIYPLYALTLAFDLPRYLHATSTVTHIPATQRAASVVASFLMLQGWNVHWTGLNPPSWSLSAEAFFYLLFPWFGPALYRLRRQWVVGMLLLLPSVGVALTFLTDPANKPTYDPLRPLPTFLMGIVLSRLATDIAAHAQWRERLRRSVPALVVVCVALLLAGTRIAHWHALLENGLLAPVFALLILAFTVDSRLSALLSARWLVLLGEASFGLYLIHMPIKALLRIPLERHFPLVFPVYLSGVVLLSVCSFLYLEAPARVWILQRFGYMSRESTLTSSIAQ